MNEPFISINVWTWLFTIANLLILVFVMTKLLYKPVKKILKQREDEIKETYDLADKTAKEANELKAEYEEHLAKTKQEANEILSNATKKAQLRSDEIIADASNQADQIIEKANARIERDKQLAINEAKDEISEMAIMAAEKIVKSSLDESEQRQLVDDFINNLDEIDPKAW